MSNTNLVEITSEIIAAYVSNNEVESAQLSDLIEKVYSTLQDIMEGAGYAHGGANKPAVPIKQSVFDDYLICLEDGQKFKSLKRHLKAHYDMTPEEYRQKWGLPSDYPMVAPLYAERRSKLAKEIGLGTARAGMKNKKKATSDAA